jgi:Uma2 family endonuclease
MAMSVKQHLVTAEAFFEMPDPPDRRLDLVDGQVVEKPLLGAQAALANANLLSALGAFVEHNNCGIVLPGVGHVLHRDPDTVRHVGIAFIPWERVPAGEPTDWFWEGAPTLAIEAVSFYGTAADFHLRVWDYLRAGTRVVWVLWPDTRSVSIHRPDGTSLEIGPDATLDGGDILPGFTVTVGDLFETRRRRQ